MQWLVLTSLIIVAAAGLLAARHYAKPTAVNPNYHYQFSSRKTADDLPNSVVFSYDAGTDKHNQVMIQQSWDTSRRELVDPLGHQHTSIYYYPGYFRAKLLVAGTIVKQTPVFIPTKGWKAIAECAPLPVYFSDSAIRKNNGIVISPGQFATAIGGANFNNRWLQVSNIREFPGIRGDDFIFQATLRNSSSVEQSLCRQARIIILGTEGPLFVPLTSKGCIADLTIYTGDTVISGRNHDLSALGCDFAVAQNLSIAVSHKLLNLSLNGKTVLSFPAEKTLGDIVGVRILFEGAGEVKAARLSTPGSVGYDLMAP